MVIMIKYFGVLGNLNECNYCKDLTSEITSLLLVNNKWFCIFCIVHNRELFVKLKKDGYWFNILLRLTRFNKELKSKKRGK